MEFVDFGIDARKHVLILGHSYVRCMEQANINFNLAHDTFVYFCGMIRNSPLNLIQDLVNNADWIFQTYPTPDIVVLVLGTNDLMYFDRCHPDEIASSSWSVPFTIYIWGEDDFNP